MLKSNTKQALLIILGSLGTFIILGGLLQFASNSFFLMIRFPLALLSVSFWSFYIIKKHGFSKAKCISIIFLLICATVGTMDIPVNQKGYSQDKSIVQGKTTANSIEHFKFTEDIIQKTYNQASQAAGVGSPKVDCSFSSYYENNIDGLIYVKGEYTLSDSKATHTYNARYGAGSNDMVFLSLDGKTVFFDENKQTQYMDKK